MNPREYSNHLMKTNLYTMSNEECAVARRRHIFDYEICASANGTNVCYADSGAPMVIQNKFVGILKGGVCSGGAPAVFDRIDHHHLWIINEMHELNHQ